MKSFVTEGGGGGVQVSLEICNVFDLLSIFVDVGEGCKVGHFLWMS